MLKYIPIFLVIIVLSSCKKEKLPEYYVSFNDENIDKTYIANLPAV
jgi:hypothetical protein